MCIDEDDVSNRESTRPSDGHAGDEAPDFVDTVPMLRDEMAASPAAAPSVTRQPVARAKAHHESVSAAPSATVVAHRDEGSQRPRISPPTSPARLRIDSTAKVDAGHMGGPRPDAPPSQMRATRTAPPAVAVSTKGDGARRLREDWAAKGSKTHVATLSPSVPRSDEGTRSPGWTAASRPSSPRPALRHGTRRGAGGTSFVRATLLAISIGTAATAVIGAIAYIARRDAQAPGAVQAAAASPQRPKAMAPAPQAPEASAPEVDSDVDAAPPSTPAPDVHLASVRRTSAVPSRTRNLQDATSGPRLEPVLEPGSQRRPSARGVAPSNNVASAVEAAQAKADAFLRDAAHALPEQPPAKSGTSDLPHDAGHS
jgi:hypothetical protein